MAEMSVFRLGTMDVKDRKRQTQCLKVKGVEDEER